jgi:hypothetical protein
MAANAARSGVRRALMVGLRYSPVPSAPCVAGHHDGPGRAGPARPDRLGCRRWIITRVLGEVLDWPLTPGRPDDLFVIGVDEWHVGASPVSG